MTAWTRVLMGPTWIPIPLIGMVVSAWVLAVRVPRRNELTMETAPVRDAITVLPCVPDRNFMMFLLLSVRNDNSGQLVLMESVVRANTDGLSARLEVRKVT